MQLFKIVAAIPPRNAWSYITGPAKHYYCYPACQLSKIQFDIIDSIVNSDVSEWLQTQSRKGLDMFLGQAILFMPGFGKLVPFQEELKETPWILLAGHRYSLGKESSLCFKALEDMKSFASIECLELSGDLEQIITFACPELSFDLLDGYEWLSFDNA